MSTIAEYENKILEGDNIEILKSLPNNFIDCCVTSPPYYGLRDYGTGKWIGGNDNCTHKPLKNNRNICSICGAIKEDKQVGLEDTPEEYIDRLVNIFREVKRVLKDDGTLWVNIGDSYSSNNINNIKQKDLIGIPWMLAFALRNDGWYLRQDIVWNKLNPLPESVNDRFTKSHEYIFLLSKQLNYYFDVDAVKEIATGYDGRKGNLLKMSKKYKDAQYLANHHNQTMAVGGRQRWSEDDDGNYIRRKRDVFSVPNQPLADAHFATYPEKLIEPCILAGSRENGIVLDPFFGSGTTGKVAIQHGRNFLGIELNPEYIELARKRVSNDGKWII